MFPRRVGVVTPGWLLAAFAVVSCGDDESLETTDSTTSSGASGLESGEYPYLAGEYDADCAGYSQKLRDCGILGEGPFTCNDPVTPEDICAYECAGVASCGILAELVCRGVRAFPLEQCFIACNTFQCESGEPVNPTWVCDGYADCSDGSDEDNCFECGSGEEYAPRFVCDGYTDCLDGSDEHACDGFHCGSGEMIPKDRECDMNSDCADASDESECEVFVCEATSQSIYPHWQCDGTEDCLDGSDEKGCAPMYCSGPYAP